MFLAEVLKRKVLWRFTKIDSERYFSFYNFMMHLSLFLSLFVSHLQNNGKHFPIKRGRIISKTCEKRWKRFLCLASGYSKVRRELSRLRMLFLPGKHFRMTSQPLELSGEYLVTLFFLYSSLSSRKWQWNSCSKKEYSYLFTLNILYLFIFLFHICWLIYSSAGSDLF